MEFSEALNFYLRFMEVKALKVLIKELLWNYKFDCLLSATYSFINIMAYLNDENDF